MNKTCSNCGAPLPVFGNVCSHCEVPFISVNNVVSRTDVMRIMVDCLSLDDVKIMCEKMKDEMRKVRGNQYSVNAFDYENLPAESKSGKIREYILTASRRNCLSLAIEQACIVRPEMYHQMMQIGAIR